RPKMDHPPHTDLHTSVTQDVMPVMSTRLCLAILTLAAAASAQLPEDKSKVEWLSRNLLSIRTIDPDDDDFADLTALKKAVGDARIVQLGEQSHGDGATYYAKERLIRFL